MKPGRRFVNPMKGKTKRGVQRRKAYNKGGGTIKGERIPQREGCNKGRRTAKGSVEQRDVRQRGGYHTEKAETPGWLAGLMVGWLDGWRAGWLYG